jgi:type VI secretion system protein ImpA
MAILSMSMIDVTALLEPVSPDLPCGENLEYDADYAALELAASGKPEQQFGETVIPAEDPNWEDVFKRSLSLLQRTKDLRVALYLIRSAASTQGASGLADGLEFMQGLVRDYWDGIHPQLDPEDDNDPTLRVNTIMGLCDPAAVLRIVREAPLVRSRLGQFSYRDVLVAAGEHAPPKGTPPIEQTTIDAAFAECDAEGLKTTARAICRGFDAAAAIEATVTDQVGVSRAPNLQDLSDLLKGMKKTVLDRVAMRGLSLDAPVESAAPAVADGAGTGTAPAGAAAVNGHAPAGPALPSGEFNSREDVILALDKICDYYKRYEPSSPVPLFLNRAKRLASKSFLEILRDLTPDALSQALSLGGIHDAPDEASH